jgi:hypothetical protein
LYLELRNVEIRARTLREQVTNVVEEIEAKIEEGTRHRPPINDKVVLDKMQSSWTNLTGKYLVCDTHTSNTAGLALSLYSLLPTVAEMVPLTASRRLIWPSMLFSQVGELASSKSAMKVLAPELRALITILRDTGPEG